MFFEENRMNDYKKKRLRKRIQRVIALVLCFTILLPTLPGGDGNTADALPTVHDTTDDGSVLGYCWTRAWSGPHLNKLIKEAQNAPDNPSKEARVLITYDDKYYIAGADGKLNGDGEFTGGLLPSSMKIDQFYFTTKRSYNVPYIDQIEADKGKNSPSYTRSDCWSYNINLADSSDKKGKKWLYHENIHLYIIVPIIEYFFTFQNGLNDNKDSMKGSFNIKCTRLEDIQFNFNPIHECFKKEDFIHDRMIELYQTNDPSKLSGEDMQLIDMYAEMDVQTLWYMYYWTQEDGVKYKDAVKFLAQRHQGKYAVQWSPNTMMITTVLGIVMGIVAVLTLGIGIPFIVVTAAAMTAVAIAFAVIGVTLVSAEYAALGGIVGTSTKHHYDNGEKYINNLLYHDRDTVFYPSIDLLVDETTIPKFVYDTEGKLDDEDVDYKPFELSCKDYEYGIWKEKYMQMGRDYVNKYDDHDAAVEGCTTLLYDIKGECDAAWRWDGARVYASCHESGEHASFKIFIGYPEKLPTINESFTVEANQTKVIEDINIAEGVVINVNKGGTLVIRGKVESEGILNVKGTLLIEEGACLTDNFAFDGNRSGNQRYIGTPLYSGDEYKNALGRINSDIIATAEKSAKDAKERASKSLARGKKGTLTPEQQQKANEQGLAAYKEVYIEEYEKVFDKFTGTTKGADVANTSSGSSRYLPLFTHEEFDKFKDAFRFAAQKMFKNCKTESDLNSTAKNFKSYVDYFADNTVLIPDGSIVVNEGGLLYVQSGAALFMVKNPLLQARDGGNIIIDGLAACQCMLDIYNNSSLEVGPTGELIIGATINLENDSIKGDYTDIIPYLRSNSSLSILRVFEPNEVLVNVGFHTDEHWYGDVMQQRMNIIQVLDGISVDKSSTFSSYGITELIDGSLVWSTDGRFNKTSSNSYCIGLDGVWRSITSRCSGVARFHKY